MERGSGGKLKKPNVRSQAMTPYARPVNDAKNIKWWKQPISGTVTGLLPFLFSRAFYFAISFFTGTPRSDNKLENLSNGTTLSEFDHRLDQVKLSNDNRLKEVKSMGVKFTDDVKPREEIFDTHAGTEAVGNDLTQENFVNAEDELADSNKFTGEALNTPPHHNCDVGTSNGSDCSGIDYGSQIAGGMYYESKDSDNCQNMMSNKVSGDGSHGKPKRSNPKRSMKTPSYLNEYYLI